MAGEMKALIAGHLAGHRELFARLEVLSEAIAAAATRIAEVLAAGGSVWLAGNGGSAADAQHIAAEMEGRLESERPARAVHTLGANSSTLSSVGNDYGFAEIFARQVTGFVAPRDLLLLISTSGKSPNLLRAAEAARAQGRAGHRPARQGRRPLGGALRPGHHRARRRHAVDPGGAHHHRPSALQAGGSPAAAHAARRWGLAPCGWPSSTIG